MTYHDTQAFYLASLADLWSLSSGLGQPYWDTEPYTSCAWAAGRGLPGAPARDLQTRRPAMSHPEPQRRRDENSGTAFWRTSAQPRVLAFTGKRAGLPAVGPATDSGCELTEKGKSGEVAVPLLYS